MHLAAHKAKPAILLHVESRRYHLKLRLVYNTELQFSFTRIDITQCIQDSHKRSQCSLFPETLLSLSVVHNKLSGITVQHDTSACTCRKTMLMLIYHFGGIWAQAALLCFGDGMHHMLIC